MRLINTVNPGFCDAVEGLSSVTGLLIRNGLSNRAYVCTFVFSTARSRSRDYRPFLFQDDPFINTSINLAGWLLIPRRLSSNVHGLTVELYAQRATLAIFILNLPVSDC